MLYERADELRGLPDGPPTLMILRRRELWGSCLGGFCEEYSQPCAAPCAKCPTLRRVVRNLLLSRVYTRAPASQKGLLVPIHDTDLNDTSPREVFAILSDDVDRCFELISHTGGSSEEVEDLEYDETAVRSYARAAFACMEGMTFCMRAWAAERVPEPRAEQQGDLESDVTAMFSQLDEVARIEPQLGTGRQWWLNLQKALQLRRRMTHPRSWTDLALTREEILTVVDADAGFRLLLSRYLEV